MCLNRGSEQMGLFLSLDVQQGFREDEWNTPVTGRLNFLHSEAV